MLIALLGGPIKDNQAFRRENGVGTEPSPQGYQVRGRVQTRGTALLACPIKDNQAFRRENSVGTEQSVTQGYQVGGRGPNERHCPACGFHKRQSSV
jgi:Zn ribbon nucleic-acid-binding protein